MADQFGGGDQAMFRAEFPHPAAKTSKAQGGQPCSKRHHGVVRNPDSIARAGKAKKKEGAEISGDQREEKHTCPQTAIGQKVGVGTFGLTNETLSTQPEQSQQISNESKERRHQRGAHGRAIQAAIRVSAA